MTIPLPHAVPVVVNEWQGVVQEWCNIVANKTPFKIDTPCLSLQGLVHSGCQWLLMGTDWLVWVGKEYPKCTWIPRARCLKINSRL